MLTKIGVHKPDTVLIFTVHLINNALCHKKTGTIKATEFHSTVSEATHMCVDSLKKQAFNISCHI